MKLRNKKTGNIVWIPHISLECKMYKSIAHLVEDYEDLEPLIKEPKIRKAVKAWAEANDFDEVDVDFDIEASIWRFSNGMIDISFIGELGLKYGTYDIEILCGDKECEN